MRIQKLAVYGDSISSDLIGNGGYAKQLARLLNIEQVYNHAVPESGISSTTPDNLVSLLKIENTFHQDADAIILWHGTNDWYWGAPIGSAGCKDTGTYIGALEHCIGALRENNPRSALVLLTPLYRLQAPNGSELVKEGFENPNGAGLPLQSYYEAVIKNAKRLCAPYLDTRTQSGFCKENAEIYLPDGIHPSEKGCGVLARLLASYFAAAPER